MRVIIQEEALRRSEKTHNHQFIHELPTIEAVPVVRCKDCVHYKPKNAMTPGDNRMRCDHPCLDYDIECYDLWLDVEPNDYCKYGEKKMDGGSE